MSRTPDFPETPASHDDGGRGRDPERADETPAPRALDADAVIEANPVETPFAVVHGLAARLEPQMEVLGSDEEFIGEVKEIRANDFLVDRPLQRDLYVPLDAIQSICVDLVLLSVTADQVERMGWHTTATIRKPEA